MSLVAREEIDKGLMVMVKRGEGVNIVEDDTPPYMYEDIRSVEYGITWSGLQEICDRYP